MASSGEKKKHRTSVFDFGATLVSSTSSTRQKALRRFSSKDDREESNVSQRSNGALSDSELTRDGKAESESPAMVDGNELTSSSSSPSSPSSQGKRAPAAWTSAQSPVLHSEATPERNTVERVRSRTYGTAPLSSEPERPPALLAVSVDETGNKAIAGTKGKVAEDNPSPFHLGQQRSVELANGGHRTMRKVSNAGPSGLRSQSLEGEESLMHSENDERDGEVFGDARTLVSSDGSCNRADGEKESESSNQAREEKSEQVLRDKSEKTEGRAQGKGEESQAHARIEESEKGDSEAKDGINRAKTETDIRELERGGTAGGKREEKKKRMESEKEALPQDTVLHRQVSEKRNVEKKEKEKKKEGAADEAVTSVSETLLVTDEDSTASGTKDRIENSQESDENIIIIRGEGEGVDGKGKEGVAKEVRPARKGLKRSKSAHSPKSRVTKEKKLLSASPGDEDGECFSDSPEMTPKVSRKGMTSSTKSETKRKKKKVTSSKMSVTQGEGRSPTSSTGSTSMELHSLSDDLNSSSPPGGEAGKNTSLKPIHVAKSEPKGTPWTTRPGNSSSSVGSVNMFSKGEHVPALQEGEGASVKVSPLSQSLYDDSQQRVRHKGSVIGTRNHIAGGEQTKFGSEKEGEKGEGVEEGRAEGTNPRVVRRSHSDIFVKRMKVKQDNKLKDGKPDGKAEGSSTHRGTGPAAMEGGSVPGGMSVRKKSGAEEGVEGSKGQKVRHRFKLSALDHLGSNIVSMARGGEHDHKPEQAFPGLPLQEDRPFPGIRLYPESFKVSLCFLFFKKTC